MKYKLPDKSLLEEKSAEIIDNKYYYNLSKLIFKKDLDKKLLFPVGINSEDKYFIDLKEKSSMFITGETGSGKSMFLNSIIISLLLKNTPDELMFLFVDPRKVELLPYEKLPHTLSDIASSKEEGLGLIKSLKKELEKRQSLFLQNNVKTIDDFNEITNNKLPHIIMIIDEATDLIKDKHFEDKLIEIINDGYRYGIHIIISTSSYLKDDLSKFFLNSMNYIVTFDLATKENADYIKIKEADLLTVYGEALIKCNGTEIIDLQTPYISTKDICKVVDFITKQG